LQTREENLQAYGLMWEAKLFHKFDQAHASALILLWSYNRDLFPQRPHVLWHARCSFIPLKCILTKQSWWGKTISFHLEL